jgi:aryl-alcohol dehydrogenase-like predicted oxidoreductase
MRDTDHRYALRRLREEEERAEAASNVEVERVHRALAEAYRARVQQIEERLANRAIETRDLNS